MLQTLKQILKMTSIRLPDHLEARLNQLSKKTHRTKSFYITQALEQYMEDFEDLYIAVQRSSESNSKFYTTEEAREYLGLKDDL